MKFLKEIQITNDLSYNHDLDNNDNFSPDNKWLVYDTRTEKGGIAASAKIEKVNINTGEIQVLYRLENNQDWGPGVGAVSYSSKENAVVFIHGLLSVSEKNPYQQWRRTGVIIDEKNIEKPIFMDARDVDFPYTKGALRGGTHRHEWSGDWVGFTYNDAIMQELEAKTGQKHNLRTIGVSKRGQSVKVNNLEEGENVAGEWFSALVVRVVPKPKAGSDEISNAAGDSWIGANGYLKPDGQRQLARAFIGTIQDKNGNNVDEVFVVDIPERIDIEGEYGSLEGTETSMPMPPKGTIQRRLTFTAHTDQPGCLGIVRSSLEGNLMAFLAKDKNGIFQIFSISPMGGTMNQVTFHKNDVNGNIRWHPTGKSIFYINAGSIHECKIGGEAFEKRNRIITEPMSEAPTNLVVSHDGKILAFNRNVYCFDNQAFSKQIFIIKL